MASEEVKDYLNNRAASRDAEHDLTTEFDGHEWTVEFPVMIDCTYKQGSYDKVGMARHGYAFDAPFIDTPQQARRHYSKRFGIVATYRLSESSLISTTVTDQMRRLRFVVISPLIQSAWQYPHWEYVATRRLCGRRLWWWPFEEFIRMVTPAAWTALTVRRAVLAKRPPDDRFVR